jgi:hypothetical protein
MHHNKTKIEFFSSLQVKKQWKLFLVQEFFHSSLVQWVFIGALLLNISNWILIAFFIRPVDFPIILHYNVYFGVDVIGSWWQVYFLPIIGLIVLAVNTTLGYLFYGKKERMVAHLLMLAIFMVQIAMTIAVASILLINY